MSPAPSCRNMHIKANNNEIRGKTRKCCALLRFFGRIYALLGTRKGTRAHVLSSDMEVCDRGKKGLFSKGFDLNSCM